MNERMIALAETVLRETGETGEQPHHVWVARELATEVLAERGDES